MSVEKGSEREPGERDAGERQDLSVSDLQDLDERPLLRFKVQKDEQGRIESLTPLFDLTYGGTYSAEIDEINQKNKRTQCKINSYRRILVVYTSTT